MDELLEAYARLLDRQRQLAEEELGLRQALVERLRQVPDRRWRVSGGEWALSEPELRSHGRAAFSAPSTAIVESAWLSV